MEHRLDNFQAKKLKASQKVPTLIKFPRTTPDCKSQQLNTKTLTLPQRKYSESLSATASAQLAQATILAPAMKIFLHTTWIQQRRRPHTN